MLVLDCCAAMEIVRRTDLGDWVFETIESADKIIAPSLFPAELTNALRTCVRAGVISKEQARECAELAIGLIDEYIDTRENALEALAEGIRLNHATYDMFYFTLARRNACTLVTADARLAQLCSANGVKCIFFGGSSS